ncbi:MAG: Nif3-like dinuclear metal center hexameric protein [Muribaculum sp.]|nr:Nif3-like dinuclear metal center hexameric protein [Muribaculum sp.]
MPTFREIISAIETIANPSLQEPWDNTGWQLLPMDPDSPCSGVLTCLDVTPEVISEAKDGGFNLIISHHPLIFKGIKHLTGATQVETSVIEAIRSGIGVYSSHTALDSAPQGVSHRLGDLLGLVDAHVLAPQSGSPDTGLGIIGNFPTPLTRAEVVSRVKEVYGSPVVRCSSGAHASEMVNTLALSSGSGGEFIPLAMSSGADAYITSDTRYHDFVDYGKNIFIIDTGHFESEKCTKSIFSTIISEKFPNFAVRMSEIEKNPVNYV